MTLLKFFQENGWLITAQKLINIIARKIFSFFLSRKISSGSNLNLSPSAYVRGVAHIKIGDNFRAGEFLRLEAILDDKHNQKDFKILIKDNVLIEDFVHIGAINYVEIGNNVLIASKVYISDHNHGLYSGANQSSPDIHPFVRERDRDKKVIIGDNVWLGEFVSILPGVTIGSGSVIGANSVVTKDVPPNSIAVGNPAKVIKQYDVSLASWQNVIS